MLKNVLTVSVCLGFALPVTAQDANEAAIEGAMSAAPASVSRDSRVLDWNFNELRPGTNEWTCLPDYPDSPGADPMCVTGPWLDLLKAYMNQEKPNIKTLGISYMLVGEGAGSNTDPFASEPREGNDWIESVGAHIMIVVPDGRLLEGYPTDHRNGGPWIMWAGTPYEHLMVPIDSRDVATHVEAGMHH